MKLSRILCATLAALVAMGTAQAQTVVQNRFTVSSAVGDEVADSITGLIWKRCSEGQTWNRTTCTGTPATYTHEQALAQAQSQSGAMGWRLPNVKELSSLVDSSLSSPAIDALIFPATPSNWYWTSTPGATSIAWCVDFYDGHLSSLMRTGNYHVRLVR